MVEYGRVKPEILEKLEEIVGASNVSLSPEDLEKHSVDESLEPPHPPEVVVKPVSTAEVSDIMKLAY
jgi:FAD/FMN-containing dehydrogenase